MRLGWGTMTSETVTVAQKLKSIPGGLCHHCSEGQKDCQDQKQRAGMNHDDKRQIPSLRDFHDTMA